MLTYGKEIHLVTCTNSSNVPIQGDVAVIVYSMALFVTNHELYCRRSDYYSKREVPSELHHGVLVENMIHFRHDDGGVTTSETPVMEPPFIRSCYLLVQTGTTLELTAETAYKVDE